MQEISRRAVILGVAALTAGCAAQNASLMTAPESASQASADTTAMDQVLRQAVGPNKVAGLVAAAATDGGTFYEGAFGKRSLDGDADMTPDSVFWIASMTKPITCTAAMQMVEQGKLKLDVLRTELDKLVVPAAKPSGQVAIMDFVKIKDGRRDEALFYYENNWKIYRDAAIKKGFIKSYELVEGDAVANSQFDLVLITRFANEEQFKNTETNFQPIIKQLRPTGPVLKNDLKPDDFRQNVFARVVRTQLPSIITN